MVFGDLKTYKYTVKSLVLEYDTSHIQQRKANILKSLVTQQEFEILTQAV